MSDIRFGWAVETMSMINNLTTEVSGKAFDPGWFLLRERLEQAGAVMDAQFVDPAKLVIHKFTFECTSSDTGTRRLAVAACDQEAAWAEFGRKMRKRGMTLNSVHLVSVE